MHLEEVEDRVSKGGWKLQRGASLPKHFGHIGRQSVGGFLWDGTCLAISSPGGLSISIVIVTRRLIVSLLSDALGICPFEHIISNVAPCFAQGK